MRKQFEKVVADKHEDVLARFGAILAQGIIDAGTCSASFLQLVALVGWYYVG